jgi:hypothetical protein
MNKIKNFLMIVAITSLLVMSASLVSNQSYGSSNDHNNKEAGSKSEKVANQNSVQESDCQRSEDCQQANQAQQTRGKGNDVVGFNDDSDNIPLSNFSSTLFSPPSPVTLETDSPDNRNVTVTIPDEGVCSGGSIKVAVSATGLPAFLCVGVQGTPITSAGVQLGASGQSCPTGFSPSTILIGRETLDLCVKVFV